MHVAHFSRKGLWINLTPNRTIAINRHGIAAHHGARVWCWSFAQPFALFTCDPDKDRAIRTLGFTIHKNKG